MATAQRDASTPRQGPRRIRAVDHAIDVLECLARAGAPIGVTDLTRQLELSKASVHHILGTLEARGLVMREPDLPLYRLGWNLYELGSSVVRSVDVSRIARPFLDKLALETGESVLLGILDGDSVLYLDRGDAPHGFHMVAAAGRRSPLHATASGKFLLAFADDEFAKRYLKRSLESFTLDTLTDPSILRQQLAEIRAQGYATCWQERELGLCSVAVPLRNHTGEVVASLTLAGPAGRLTEDSVDAHLEALRGAADQIEAQLGVSHQLETEVAPA
jgi:DNA-binding IclR family transcriptional regulator